MKLLERLFQVTRKEPYFSFERQMQFEDEGALAAMSWAESRDECPYDHDGSEEDNFRWNHWVYGFDSARHELLTLAAGTLSMWNVGPSPKYEKLAEWTETTQEAYRAGHWRPQYVKVPEAWGPPPIMPRQRDR